MKNTLALVGLAFWLLLCCESNDVDAPIVFNGQIIDRDTNPSSPLKDVWTKIRYYGDGLSLLGADSVLSNEFGSYTFQIQNSEAIKQYSIEIQDDYFFKCNSFMRPVIGGFTLPKDIARTKANSDTINACVTGRVKLVFSKLDASAKDTLMVTSKIKIGSLTFAENPTNVYGDTTLVEYFFSEKVSSVDYEFKLTKESGESTNWVLVESIEGRTTNELLVPF